MTYKGFKGYKPIITAFKELPTIVYHRFRDGAAMGGAVEAIKAAYMVLPEGKRIRHASLDSEFYSAEVINLLMQRAMTFTIAVDKDHAVKEAIRGLSDWRPFKTKEGDKTDREIAETVHTMNKTDKAFRLVVLRWHKEMLLPEGYRTKTIQTLRWSLIGIAGKVVKHGRLFFCLQLHGTNTISIFR